MTGWMDPEAEVVENERGVFFVFDAEEKNPISPL